MGVICCILIRIEKITKIGDRRKEEKLYTEIVLQDSAFSPLHHIKINPTPAFMR